MSVPAPTTVPVVLNVDDAEAIRYVKTRILERAGFSVLEAGTGRQALALVESAHPDLVLLDVKLPDISGIEVCKAIKRDFPGVLVMQVSAAYVDRSDRVRGLDSGADSYLPQPVEPEELVAAVRALLRIRHMEEALRQSQAQLAAIFSQTAAGIVQADLDGRITLVNDRLCTLLGQTRDAILQRSVQDLIAPPGPAADRTALPRVDDGYETEVRHVRPDGAEVWLHNTVNLIRDGKGHPKALIAVCLDITARRAAEERQALLAREVDHRAKNMLAVVQAVLRLTRAGSQPEFVQAVEGRVASLARTHSVLAASRWAGADLRTLIEDELSVYGDLDRSRVGIQGPDVALTAESAQAFGLALHELATNAAKYGSLSAPEGRLSVTWARDPDGSVLLCWQETGGPPVNAPTHRGFGSRVIQGSIADQLQGSVRLDWRAEGLYVEFRVPADQFSTAAPAPVGPSFDATTPCRGGELPGLRIMVVEDQPLLALELATALAEIGCDIIGPAGALAEAMTLVETEAPDAAVIDADLGGHCVLPLADVLAGRGIPFVVCTGFGDRDILGARHAGVPFVRKPAQRSTIFNALAGVVAASGRRPPSPCGPCPAGPDRAAADGITAKP